MSFDPSDITDIIEGNEVVIFGKGDKGTPMCGFTAQVQDIFTEIAPDYEMINILEDPELKQGMKEFSNWPTFPQVYIHGEFIGGADIIAELYEDGELEEILEGEPESHNYRDEIEFDEM